MRSPVQRPSSTDCKSVDSGAVVSQSHWHPLADWGVLKFTEEHHKPQCTTCDGTVVVSHVVAAGRWDPRRGEQQN
jgi:hypothetical protein